MITQEILNNYFEYRDGELYKKSNPDKPIGTIKNGTKEYQKRKQIVFKRKCYLTHRIIFFMHHGYLPVIVDHIDNNPLNNRIENLRAATPKQSSMNVRITCRNNTGFKNVSYDSKLKKYYVRIRVHGKPMHFGYYYDLKVAAFIAETMRYKYCGKFAKS